MGYYLLLARDRQYPNRGFRVCGTYRDSGEDRAALLEAEAHAVVNEDDFLQAQKPGSWRFSPGQGLFRN